MIERMPELPEVETVRRGLAPHIEGRRIVDFTLNRADLRFPFPKGFKKRMSGAQIKSFSRRAKYLLADMRDARGASFTWLSHLGMTGRFMLSFPEEGNMEPGAYIHDLTPHTAQKHIHVEIGLDDGTHLTFADPRRFGFMDYFTGDMSASPFLAALGPEPLGNDFNETGLLASAQGRKTPVKNFLLDQNVVAGLGNIYVCEALFIAGISPRRQAGNLGAKRIARLVPAVRDVLARAIEAGGSTLRDFAHEDGSRGYFQHQFAVYGRNGEACSAAGCSARLKRLAQSGRSTFYCPSCQK